MDLRTRTSCSGCGDHLTGRQRKWCSEACRVRAYHDRQRDHEVERHGECQRCGRELVGSQRKWCSSRCLDRERFGIDPCDPRSCERCETIFTPVSGRQRYCAPDCAKAQHREDHPEQYEYPGYTDQRRANDSRRRALKRGADVGDEFTHEEIYERDGWRCHLCDENVDCRLEWPDPWSASLDHIVPLAQGGEHSRRNVALAHLRCNIAKGDRAVGEQLRLVG